MASRVHSIWPRLALVSLIPLAALAVAGYRWFMRRYGPLLEPRAFVYLEGRWRSSDTTGACTTDWHEIRFSADHRVMRITSSRPYKRADGRLDSVTVYDIKSHWENGVRGAIRGETRLTKDGRPVVWDLVLRSSDTYVWHRTDWGPGRYTSEVERCPDLL
jgi:hypothetical protein